MEIPNSSETFRDERDRTRKFILGLIYIMTFIIIITLLIAILLYPEPYIFFSEFISALGGHLSRSLLTNKTSMIVFVTGFCIISTITLTISITYFVKRNLKYWMAKGIFSLLLTIGAIGIAIPHDTLNMRIVHGFGAFLFIFGFAMFNFYAQTMRFIRKRKLRLYKKQIGIILDIIVSIIVFLALLLFLIFYFFRYSNITLFSPYMPEISQKIILIVDCIAVIFLDLNDL